MKNQFSRMSSSSETIPQKRTSVMIRDQYINSVDTMYKEQLRKKKRRDEEEERKNTKTHEEHANLRFAFNIHA